MILSFLLVSSKFYSKHTNFFNVQITGPRCGLMARVTLLLYFPYRTRVQQIWHGCRMCLRTFALFRSLDHLISKMFRIKSKHLLNNKHLHSSTWKRYSNVIPFRNSSDFMYNSNWVRTHNQGNDLWYQYIFPVCPHTHTQIRINVTLPQFLKI